MSTLGELNLPALNNFTVYPQDLADMQSFGVDQIRAFLSEKRSVGVLSGCSVVPGTGLDVKVMPGLVLLPDGRLAYVLEESVVTLESADSTYSRLDRIETEFEIIDGRSGTNEDNQSVVVVKLHRARSSSKTGVPSATPVAPAKSSGKITLAIVTVAPLATIIASTAIDSSVKSRDISEEIQSVFPSQILNAQAIAVPLKNGRVDKTKFKQVVIEGDLYRKTNSQSKTAWVRLILSYNIFTDQWVFIPEIKGEAPGVTFTFDQAKEEVKYESSDLTGAGYESAFNFYTKVIVR